jgi:hypothetical protein
VALLAIAGCNPGVAPPHNRQNEALPARNSAAAAPQIANEIEAAPVNRAEGTSTLETPPSPATMTPYRRREYERGYRDCMSGNFDGERQGESYRIGCMAAAEARER